MTNPIVTNLRSPRSGVPVANQYEVLVGDEAYFQSYQTMIAKKSGQVFIVSTNWDYSRTTARYFVVWLRMYGFNDFEIESIKRWLRRADYGDELVELMGSRVTVKYVEEL